MKDFVIYTLLRLGLFLLTWGAVTGAWLLITDKAALGLTFLIALVISGIGSYFVLAVPRERLARHVEARASRATAAIEERRAREDAAADAAEAEASRAADDQQR
ncbi:DUF4229 domain-containing protein [Nocardioides rubriscoriae]|uniref:DUF4229 domain-containing protein n=1 Tax=Nocardioides rubriscoriae TaxID=642762 RepID=UPI0011E00E91|nr:DUF4229 domain-containing protein [Nocardioides rubriscoriae]